VTSIRIGRSCLNAYEYWSTTVNGLRQRYFSNLCRISQLEHLFVVSSFFLQSPLRQQHDNLFFLGVLLSLVVAGMPQDNQELPAVVVDEMDILLN